MALMAVTAVFLGAWTSTARRQHQAVREIRLLGGNVQYDFEADGREMPSAPAWAVQVFGVDPFADVVSVDFNRERRNGTKGDKILAAAENLHRLRSLQLDGGGVTDAGLSHVKELTELEHLGVFASWVTDDGLLHLAKLTKLKDLNLGATNVTDAGLTRLTHLKNLRTFYVLVGPRWGTTDEGLAAFGKKMPNLRTLSIYHD